MMNDRFPGRLLAGALLVCCALSPVLADDGRADLEKAIDLKLSNPSVEKLSEVITLCEQAIKKGLPPDDEKFAKELLTASLFGRAESKFRLLLGGSTRDRNWPRARDAVLGDLEKVVQSDEKFGQAHLMIARLQLLPGGNQEKARDALDRAIESLADDRQSQADAYLLRGQLQDDPEKTLADLDRAVELDPESAEAWQARALFHLNRGAVKDAIADFDRLLAKDNDNVGIRIAIAQALMNVKQYDESRKYLDYVIEKRPSPAVYSMRAQLWAVQEQLDKAMADLEAALKLDPGNLAVILLRARLHFAQQNHELARKDLETFLALEPDLPDAIELYSLVLANLGEYDKAIGTITKLVEEEPENMLWKLQLAIFLNAAEQSGKAAAIFTEVLQGDPENPVALRGRADAYLNLGDHGKAINDYEQAVKTQPDDSGILNNFAWVLATSPDNPLRNGKRAVELARKACELTEYKQAHILSTLGAAYAEIGDFESALQWSQKAVDASDESLKETLKKELESYQQRKPWRERKQEGQGEAPKGEVPKLESPEKESPTSGQ